MKPERPLPRRHSWHRTMRPLGDNLIGPRQTDQNGEANDYSMP